MPHDEARPVARIGGFRERAERFDHIERVDPVEQAARRALKGLIRRRADVPAFLCSEEHTVEIAVPRADVTEVSPVGVEDTEGSVFFRVSGKA